MKQQKQSGFAHLIVVTVILGLAVVGLLGYVFWQNFMQPKDNVAKTGDSSEVTEKDDKKSPAPVAEDKNTFKITEWGIKGTYKGAYPVSYSINSGEGNFVTPNAPTASFLSNDLKGVCADFAPGSFGRLTAEGKVYAANQSISVSELYKSDRNTVKQIGNYYYVYQSPHQPCYQTGSETADAVWVTISNDIKDYFDTLEAI